MTLRDETLWFINPSHPIALAQWNDTSPAEVIAYHLGTGDTHLLTTEGAMLLDILQRNGTHMRADEIADQFRRSLDNPSLEFDSNDIIEAFLIPFKQQGFIEATLK